MSPVIYPPPEPPRALKMPSAQAARIDEIEEQNNDDQLRATLTNLRVMLDEITTALEEIGQETSDLMAQGATLTIAVDHIESALLDRGIIP